MPEKQPCCPNCDTVLRRHYDPDDLAVMWYECGLCGYRLLDQNVRSLEADDAHHRKHAA